MPGSPRLRLPLMAVAGLVVGLSGTPRSATAAGLAQERSATVSDRQAIAAALDRSAAGWNRGDLDGFMAGYEDGPATTYIRPEGPVRGFAAVRAMYAARFKLGGRGMGRLATDLSEVRPLGADYALVTGRFRLERTAAEGGEAHGVFTLVFHRGSSGWRIVSDHTS